MPIFRDDDNVRLIYSSTVPLRLKVFNTTPPKWKARMGNQNDAIVVFRLRNQDDKSQFTKFSGLQVFVPRRLTRVVSADVTQSYYFYEIVAKRAILDNVSNIKQPFWKFLTSNNRIRISFFCRRRLRLRFRVACTATIKCLPFLFHK